MGGLSKKFDRDCRVRNCIRTSWNGLELDKDGFDLITDGLTRSG